MKDRSRRLKKHQSNPAKPRQVIQNQIPQNEELPEALQRVKDRSYPLTKSSDVLCIQKSVGNKALGRLVGVRQAVDAEIVQRHSIPRGREGVGEEEDEIQAMHIQRSPAFGSFISRGETTRRLWGDGRYPVVQRKNGKGGGAVKGAVKADPKAGPEVKVGAKKEDEAVVKQAEAEYKKFISGGPYKIDPYVPDKAEDYGKFKSVYDPARKTITADMRVKFEFPDLPVPKGDTPVEVAQIPLIKIIQDMYKQNFISQVHAGWSGKFTFRNVREPQSVWGKLNPINVKVNVRPVDSGQHYLIKGYLKKVDVANVTSNTPGKKNPSPSTLSLFKGDLDPSKQDYTNYKYTGAYEVLRLKRNLPKIHFANSSMSIDPKYIPDLRYVADYLKQMNRPKFTINVVGHANKTGNEKSNIKFSAMRARVVMDKLKAFGVVNHTLTSQGVGSVGATEGGEWRKVDFSISVDKSFTNIQDVTVHEFGHMLGLDDEYVRKKDTRKFTTQKEFMAKMLGSEAYGKGKEGKLGEERTAVLPLSSASVMESGNEVRPYHYVTLWQALYDTAATAANQPAPAFTWKDWKVSGF